MKNIPLWDSSLPDEKRLDYLMDELTLEEKLQCLGTGCPGIERLGIEPFYIGGEGAHGVQLRHDQSFDKGTPQPTTVFPNPIGMSATWDTELLEQVGNVVGTEARAAYEKEGRRGGLCLWAPTVDMERDPRWGRTEESYGEDPYLTGKMSSAYIRGMRGEVKHSKGGDERIRCGATLKHFYANNVEEGRAWKSSSIDPRNKYEYYLEPFRRAIVEGGAEALMTSYNEINGVPAIINPEISEFAKEKWGLHHVVCDGADMVQTVDFHQYFGSHTETLVAGLKAGIDCFTDDLEIVMESAREALELGLIAMDDIDQALRRHFGTMLRLGIFDAETDYWAGEAAGEADKSHNEAVQTEKDVLEKTSSRETCEETVQTEKDVPENTSYQESHTEYIKGYGLNLPAHQALARKVTAESVVLLKNDLIDEAPILPIRQEPGHKLAVIGPSADTWFMDWYTGVPPYHVTALEGIREAMADASDLLYSSGNPRFKLVCEDKYLGLLPDGQTLALVEEKDAEEFEAVLWDKERMTLRCMSNGKMLTTEDGQEEDKTYRKGTITATKDEAFGWFAKEAFLISQYMRERNIPQWELKGTSSSPEEGLSLSVGDKFQEILERGSELILRAWNEARIFVDEENRLRLPEKNGFVEEGELCRVRSCIREDGSVAELEQGTDALKLDGEFETITGRKYRTLPPVCPILTYDAVQEAAGLAKQADTVVFIGGAHPIVTCKEDTDRKDIDFPPFQRTLLQAISGKNPKVALALITCVPFAIDWEVEHIPAILTMAGGSMEQGHGLADVLFGKMPPAGRLNMTWYKGQEQLPDINDYDIIQKERTYQYFSGEVLFPFGHGLTYADMQIREMKAEVVGETVQVSCTLTNQSKQPGDEVVQLYYHKKGSAIKRPIRTLVGFCRVRDIGPGVAEKLQFTVPLEDLQYYDTIQQRKLIEPGEYEFALGRSSADLIDKRTVELTGEERGCRTGETWQPADHYDRSANAYLWEGHLGYGSVAHQNTTSDRLSLMEEADGLWQNINEVTRSGDGEQNRDDTLSIEYDAVHVPAGMTELILDADAAPEAQADIYLDKEHISSHVFGDIRRKDKQDESAYHVIDGSGWRERMFWQHHIPLDQETKEWTGTIRIQCHGDVRICRWRFAKSQM